MAIGEIVAKILRARGIADAELEEFLNPSIERLSRPEELPGIEQDDNSMESASIKINKRLIFFIIILLLNKDI